MNLRGWCKKNTKCNFISEIIDIFGCVLKPHSKYCISKKPKELIKSGTVESRQKILKCFKVPEKSKNGWANRRRVNIGFESKRIG